MARDYPAFLFYPEDFATGTAEMSPLEVGVYMRCLCHQWHKLFVPDDAIKVGRIVGASVEEMDAAWPAVRAKFKVCCKGQLKNRRLEKTRLELKRSAQSRSDSGKAGAEARWGNGKRNGKRMAKPMAKPMAKGMAKSCEDDGKTVASRVGDGDGDGDGDGIESETTVGFPEFWAAVPNKVGKLQADKAYRLAVRAISNRPVEAGPGADSPDAFLIERMLAFAASPIGRGDQKYIPHPATWLNAGRYDDDPRTWLAGRNDPRGTMNAAEQYLGVSKNGNELLDATS